MATIRILSSALSPLLLLHSQARKQELYRVFLIIIDCIITAECHHCNGWRRWVPSRLCTYGCVVHGGQFTRWCMIAVMHCWYYGVFIIQSSTAEVYTSSGETAKCNRRHQLTTDEAWDYRNVAKHARWTAVATSRSPSSLTTASALGASTVNGSEATCNPQVTATLNNILTQWLAECEVMLSHLHTIRIAYVPL